MFCSHSTWAKLRGATPKAQQGTATCNKCLSCYGGLWDWKRSHTFVKSFWWCSLMPVQDITYNTPYQQQSEKVQTERKGHFLWQQVATMPFQQSPHHPNCKLLLKVFNKPHSMFHSSAPYTRNYMHTAPVPRSHACWKALGLLKDLLLTT